MQLHCLAPVDIAVQAVERLVVRDDRFQEGPYNCLVEKVFRFLSSSEDYKGFPAIGLCVWDMVQGHCLVVRCIVIHRDVQKLMK